MTVAHFRAAGAAARVALTAAACLLAGCSPEMANTIDTQIAAADSAQPAQPSDPRIVPIPDIPAALRGCWIRDEGADNRGEGDRLIVSESSFTLDGREAKPDYINRVAEDWIDGRFANSDGDTIATMLELGSARRNGGAPDTLILREGDAGSYHFSRCRP